MRNYAEYFYGYMDEIRIQHSNIFSATPVVGLTDTITVPTAEYTDVSAIYNMILISEDWSATSNPDNGRLILFEEDVDSITLNTDLKGYISRDDGTTWEEITLEDIGNYEANKRILAGNADLSGQGTATGYPIRYKVQTFNNKDLKIHGAGINAD